MRIALQKDNENELNNNHSLLKATTNSNKYIHAFLSLYRVYKWLIQKEPTKSLKWQLNEKYILTHVCSFV